MAIINAHAQYEGAGFVKLSIVRARACVISDVMSEE